MKIVAGAPSTCSLLTIAFVVLRLCEVIRWSWWWVLSPVWLPFAAVFAAGGVLMLLNVIGRIILHLMGRKGKEAG